VVGVPRPVVVLAALGRIRENFKWRSIKLTADSGAKKQLFPGQVCAGTVEDKTLEKKAMSTTPPNG
jgi:hypothetical protein